MQINTQISTPSGIVAISDSVFHSTNTNQLSNKNGIRARDTAPLLKRGYRELFSEIVGGPSYFQPEQNFYSFSEHNCVLSVAGNHPFKEGTLYEQIERFENKYNLHFKGNMSAEAKFDLFRRTVIDPEIYTYLIENESIGSCKYTFNFISEDGHPERICFANDPAHVNDILNESVFTHYEYPEMDLIIEADTQILDIHKMEGFDMHWYMKRVKEILSSMDVEPTIEAQLEEAIALINPKYIEKTYKNWGFDQVQKRLATDGMKTRKSKRKQHHMHYCDPRVGVNVAVVNSEVSMIRTIFDLN